jgi:hypothetical protein
MLEHLYQRTLKKFSVDDPNCWTYKTFISDIELLSHFIIKCIPPTYCCESYADLFCISVDPFYSHNILYFFIHIYTSQQCSLCSLHVLYIKLGNRKIAFLFHSKYCHGIELLLTVFIEIVHMFINEYDDVTDQACLMDQEFEEIQCECNTNFSWKFCTHKDNFIRICTCMFLRYVLFCTLCNDLFALKKNRYKLPCFDYIYVPYIKG